MRTSISRLCVCCVLAGWSAGAALADAKGNKEPQEKPGPAEKTAGGSFSEIGTLGKKLKDADFYEVIIAKKEGGKMVKKTVLVQIPEGVPVLQERIGQMKDLKEGDKLQIFGKPEEREIPGGAQGGGIDRAIKRTQIVVAGSDLKINRDYKDPKEKGFKWCEAQVEKNAGSLRVKFSGDTYNVMLEKKSPIVLADKVEAPAKILKAGLKLAVKGVSTEAPDSPDKKEGQEAYKAESILIIPAALASYHDSFLSI